MRNLEISAAFEELATLYELDGANRYRVIAYREASRVIRNSPSSVAELAREDRATELPGVGKTIQEKILQLLDEGEIPAAAKLRQRFPVSLLEVTRLPGVGAKTARRIYEETGVTSLAELRAAAEEGRLRGVRGLGEKFEHNVLAAIERLETEGPSERFLLSEVRELGEELVDYLRERDASEQVELAGSARRWEDTCKDLDIIATATDPEALAAALAEHPLAAEAGSSGAAGARIRTYNGIRVDLRIVPPRQFGNLLQHFTGSKQHNVKLRERALSMGLSVSENGIAEVEGNHVTHCATEEDVYAKLGLEWIPPELRHGGDELALAEAGGLPELVEVEQIRGELHCHTTLSDGKASLAEMAAAARERGYSYLAVTDHSATHGFGNDVQADALLRRVEEVRALDGELGRFHLLAGSEVNVLPDGGLDYADEVLAELDWVIASVHTSFRMGSERMTDRIIAALEHPLVDCLGHMTGRQLLRREPYDLDVERIFEAAARTGTMIEINGNPRRRDISDRHARMAAASGVMIVCTTDAHQTATLGYMPYAVATARRAGLSAEQVANTRPWRSFAPLRKRHRAAKC